MLGLTSRYTNNPSNPPPPLETNIALSVTHSKKKRKKCRPDLPNILLLERSYKNCVIQLKYNLLCQPGLAYILLPYLRFASQECTTCFNCGLPPTPWLHSHSDTICHAMYDVSLPHWSIYSTQLICYVGSLLASPDHGCCKQPLVVHSLHKFCFIALLTTTFYPGLTNMESTITAEGMGTWWSHPIFSQDVWKKK